MPSSGASQSESRGTAGPLGGDLLARRYRLIDRVGAGGMSVVWRARDEVLDRLVAVKWLGSELADDELFRDLVRREAWATARIKHPAVAAVYDYGEVPGYDGQSLAYVVMEMLDGESLAQRLRLGPVPWRETVAICAEVADALATTHEQGVVHRDISPDNVMLTSTGLRVFDFGIAAPIGEPDDDATGSTFGTPAYVAPERLDGQPAQTATDVYSLGVLMFEMLTGQPPFPEDTWDPEAALRFRPAPRLRGVPGLPAAIVRLCQRCLAYEAAQRPPAREVADRLAAYARPWWRGRAVMAAALAFIVLAGVVATLISWASLAGTPVTWPSGPAGATNIPGPSGPSGPSSAPSASPALSSAPVAPPGNAASSQPTPTVSPTGRPGASAGPVNGQPTPGAVVTVEQALDDLRQEITTQFDAGQVRSDVAQDLRNRVEAIADRLTFSPAEQKQETIRLIDELRTSVARRATEAWGTSTGQTADPNRPAVSLTARNALFAAIDRLKAAVG
jgi:serine/threonine-protein kinase